MSRSERGTETGRRKKKPFMVQYFAVAASADHVSTVIKKFLDVFACSALVVKEHPDVLCWWSSSHWVELWAVYNTHTMRLGWMACTYGKQYSCVEGGNWAFERKRCIRRNKLNYLFFLLCRRSLKERTALSFPSPSSLKNEPIYLLLFGIHSLESYTRDAPILLLKHSAGRGRRRKNYIFIKSFLSS